MKKYIYWLPRVLAIVFIVFLGIFALDVFGEPLWFLALLMHLIPNFILIILTIIAWKHERLGGSIFIAIGLLVFILSHFEALIIAIPAVIIGALFVVFSWKKKSTS